MSAESLILSRDPQVLAVFRQLLEAVSVKVHVSGSASDARAAVVKHKFDAVIVDCDGMHDAGSVLEWLRKGRSNRSAVVVAVLDSETTIRAAYDLGANFVLDKPLRPERVRSCMRAAHGLILRERQHYFRHEVDVHGTLKTQANTEIQGRVYDVSESGIGMSLGYPAIIEGEIIFRFLLPQSKIAIEGKGEITWNDGRGNLGVEFTTLRTTSRRELGHWASQRLMVKDRSPLFINATAGDYR